MALDWKKSANDLAALLDKARAGTGAPSINYGMTDAQRGMPAPATTSNVPSAPTGYSPPAMAQSYSPPPAPSTQKVNMPQQQLPSWMGNSYSQVPGTEWYSTNPSNPNASKYRADGSPVASVGFDYTRTGGQKFDGYASQDQFKNIMNMAQGNDQVGISNYLSQQAASGGFTSNDSIYKPGGGYVNMPMSASQASVSPGGMPKSVNAPPPPAYTKNPEIDKLSRDQQLAYYANHPNEARNEIARSKDVWNSTSDAAQRQGANDWANALRQAAGISMDDANYGNAQNGSSSGVYMPMPQQSPAGPSQTGQPAAAPPPGTSNTPAPYGQMSPDTIKAEAAARIAKQIAERTRIATQTKAGYQTSFDRMKTTTGEDRTLQDSAFQRNSNPFSGKTSYDKGITNLQRERTDRENQQDLQTRLGNVDIQLSDFLNQTPEMQQQIINELTRQERAYGIDVANQTGYFNGQRNIAGQQLDLSADNQKFNQSRQTKVDNWNAYMDSVGLTGYLGTGAKADWSLLGSKEGDMTPSAKVNLLQAEGAKINNEIAKLNLDYLPTKQKLEMQQLQKQIADIGKAPYRSAEDIEYDKIKLDTAKQQLEILKNPNKTPKPKQPDDYKTDPDFASDLAHIRSNPNEASKLDTNAQQFIDAYGYDGYMALRKAAGLD